jgi:hypothetical protein
MIDLIDRLRGAKIFTNIPTYNMAQKLHFRLCKPAFSSVTVQIIYYSVKFATLVANIYTNKTCICVPTRQSELQH